MSSRKYRRGGAPAPPRERKPYVAPPPPPSNELTLFKRHMDPLATEGYSIKYLNMLRKEVKAMGRDPHYAQIVPWMARQATRFFNSPTSYPMLEFFVLPNGII